MQLGLVIVSTLLGADPIVTPDIVDAHGEQDVVIKIPATGMYRLHAQSDVGTSCTIADHLRGPFEDSAPCDIDLLLDAGLYKARLTSPQRGKGKVKVDVTAFGDIQPAVRLDDGAQIEAKLPVRTQSSAWLHIEKRQAVTLEIAGRTAGMVALWRDGRWLETPKMRESTTEPRTGKPIHRFRIDTVLDPGDTKLVVYGTQPKTWTKGPDDDVVFITRGAPPGGTARAQTFSIPAWGFVEVAVPDRALAALIELDKAPPSSVSLSAEAVEKDANVGFNRASSGPNCSVAPQSAVPACAITTGGPVESSAIVTIEGPPGTTGELSWGPLGTVSSDGYWATGATRDIEIDSAGNYFVSAPAFPLSMDGEPLGCALDRLNGKGELVKRVAVDAPVVSWTEGFTRSFNYGATSTAIWVQIDKPGLYSITGDEKTKAGCEIFKLDGWASSRVGAGEDDKCSLTRALGSGLHEIRFYGGRPGIQTLHVAQVGTGDLSGKKTPAKSACTFENIALDKGRYRLSTSSDGGASLRAFFARNTPVPLVDPLPVVIDPTRTVAVPVAPGAVITVHTRPGTKLHCGFAGSDIATKNGTCTVPAATGAATLTLASDEEMPVLAVITRPTPPLDVPVPKFDPALARLPVLSAAAPLWLDFERSQSRSMIVEVDKAGLYDLETEGLLSTSCRLRTPTIGALVDGSANGRGRNCLVQAYLKQGTYLFTATADGKSRGRAGVTLVQRPPRDLGTVVVGDELFFKVDAGELVQQVLDVKKGGALSLSAAAQGTQLSCRLDDHDGWPIVKVPADCNASLQVESGRYLLTELPLTVESRRRTSLSRQVEPVVLEGEKTHLIALNTPYQAQLGTDGKDAFSFSLAADLDVGIALDHGMQGRIYAVDAKGARTVVEVVPPVGGGGFGLRARAPTNPNEGAEDGGGDNGAENGGGGENGSENGGGDNGAENGGAYGSEGGNGEGEMPPEPEYGEGGEGGEGEAEREQQREAARGDRDRAAAELARVTLPQEAGPLAGHVVHLARGSYVLETEHSRGDVAIRYGVALNVRTLAPGVVMALPVPGRVDVVVPAPSTSAPASALGASDSDGDASDAAVTASAGLLRIKTRGDVDVRCRLRDAHGNLVGESADSGSDWNCALAMPLAPGKYSLTVEAEALQPGTTSIGAAFMSAKDTGELKDGAQFKVVAKVASAKIAPAGNDVVHDVILTSDQDFSCAVQDDAGKLLDRHVGTRTCRFLLWPGEKPVGFRVFVWTADRAASVKTILRTRTVHGTSGGKIDVDEVGRAHIAVRGRYATGPDAWCRAVSAGGGALAPCFTAASFDAGDVLVAPPGGGRVSLDEQIAQLASPVDETRVLDGSRAGERQRSKETAVHLAQVSTPFGSPSSPSCTIDGGVSAREASTCAAATGPVQESTLAAWTRQGATVQANIARRAAAWPASSGALPVGASTLSFKGESARWSLPADGFRVKLALPSDAWAVFVDESGHARDVCAPHKAPVPDRPGALATCVMRGRGGELFVVAGAVSHDVRADLLVLSTAEAPTALVGLRETKPAFPGRERLLIASASTDRIVRVEGRGSLACSIHLDNGAHIAGCKAALPAGQGAEIKVEHDELPWRVYAYPRSKHEHDALVAARFGALPANAAPSAAPLGTAIALGGNYVDRRVDLKETSAVRVRASSGVCAIAVAGASTGAGSSSSSRASSAAGASSSGASSSGASSSGASSSGASSSAAARASSTGAGSSSSSSGWRVVDAQGLGGGCDLVRVLPKGSHRVVVRAFGTAPLGGNVNISVEPVTALADGVGAEALVASGDARTFRFDLATDGEVGIGLQADADTLGCTLLDADQDLVGDGCHQFHRLKAGLYYLRIESPDDEAPRRFKPVVFGLKGDIADIPDDWLRDFFNRTAPAKTTEVIR